MHPYLILSFATGTIAILYAIFLSQKIHALPTGTAEMIAIAEAIAEGARAYLTRQYKTVTLVAIPIIILLWYFLGWLSAISFTIGAVASALAGFIGMNVAVDANVRTSEAAKTSLAKALSTAFKGGSVTGLMVAGLALFSLSLVTTFLSIFGLNEAGNINLQPLIALGFGGSLISIFARLGGGIYTKGADVGTDMVGKIEKQIPEDDPRNPGVIADLVGDNVGDDAGMAADLFETYVVTAVSTMVLGNLLAKNTSILSDNTTIFLFPLALAALAIIASIIGSWFVRLGPDKKVMPALYKGLVVTTLSALILFYPLSGQLESIRPQLAHFPVFATIGLGSIVTIGMMAITEFFTSKKFYPVQRLAKASTTGHGTNIITGLALSMKSTFPPIVLIAFVILAAFNLVGLYGVALAAMSMLSLTGIIVAIDAFGPITDNAGGISEMTNQPERVRAVTDALDSVGNTTKAVTKAYAIASAGLAALVLFASFTEELPRGISFSLSDPYILVGLFIGASLPYLFAAYAMEAVGEAAMAIVNEIRRQFKEIKGIMSGKAKPDYSRCVDIVTQASIKQMIVPALIPVIAPIAVAFILGAKALGGLLIGTIVTGLFVAISMTTGGAAWDNAKKYIEEGNFGGKGSKAHQAAVTGDTVGDPYKDTAGPAINPMIKVINVVALLIVQFLR